MSKRDLEMSDPEDQQDNENPELENIQKEPPLTTSKHASSVSSKIKTEDKGLTMKDQVRETLNELFKQAIVGRSWKNKEQEVGNLLRLDSTAFAQAVITIVTKIMLVPTQSSKQKTIDELMGVFLKIYEVIEKQFRVAHCEDKIKAILQTHIDTAFLLTHYKAKNISTRAYAWLEAVINVMPLGAISDMKRKILKSIFTHCLQFAMTDIPNAKNSDSSRIQAIRISSRICKAIKIKGKQEYIDLITNHFLKMMLEDEKEIVRQECINSLDLSLKTIPYVVTRTMDKSKLVRQEVYKALKSNTKVQFMEIDVLDRLQIILNGLNDHESDVKEACREYIINQVCLSKGSDNGGEGSDEQLEPMIKTMRAIQFRSTYTHPKISVATYLYMREILFQTYSLDSILETIEKLVKIIPQLSQQKQFGELFECLVFLNFALNIIKKNDHQLTSGFQFQNLELGVHVPTLDNLKGIIDQVLADCEGQDAVPSDEFAEMVPRLIIFQCFHLFNHLLAKLTMNAQGGRNALSEDDFCNITGMIKGFFNSKTFFERDYLNENRSIQFDYVEQMQAEETALQEIGIGIRDQEILIHVALIFLQHVCFQVTLDESEQAPNSDLERYFQVTKDIILDQRTIEELDEQEKLLIKINEKIKTYIDLQTTLSAEISKITTIGEQPEQGMLDKLAGATEKLQKYQGLIMRYQQGELLQLQHQLNMIRYLLKSIKLGMLHVQLFPTYGAIINANVTNKTVKVRALALECLGLLTIHDKALFEEKLRIYMDQIIEESTLKVKTDATIVALKCIFDGIMIHGFLLESGNVQDILRQDLRKLLMKLLRDTDYNVRLLATEGFCKLLICERMQNPWDFIARLILLYFERSKGDFGDLNQRQQMLMLKIKETIEEFFTFFPRLANERCIELFEATILSIFYLIKSRALQNSDPQWDKINVFYLFGKLSNMLEYKQNKQYAIFDLAQLGLSYQYEFLKVFSFMILNPEALGTPQEKDQFAKFFVNSLNFLDLNELPLVHTDYEREFLTFINPLFNQLSRFYEKLEQQAIVDTQWKSLAASYIKKRDSDNLRQAEHEIAQKAKQIMLQAVEAAKTVEFEEDAYSIFQHCQAFYNQTQTYQRDFSEQRTQSSQDASQRTAPHSVHDYNQQSKRAMKQLHRHAPGDHPPPQEAAKPKPHMPPAVKQERIFNDQRMKKENCQPLPQSGPKRPVGRPTGSKPPPVEKSVEKEKKQQQQDKKKDKKDKKNKKEKEKKKEEVPGKEVKKRSKTGNETEKQGMPIPGERRQTRRMPNQE